MSDYSENSSEPKRSRLSVIELLLGVAIVAALIAIAVPAFKTYRLRVKLSERTVTLDAIREAEMAFLQKWGVFGKARLAPRGEDKLDGSRAAWRLGEDAPGSGFLLIGFQPTSETYFSYCIVENPARPASPTPAPLDAARPTVECPDADSRAEHTDGRTALTGTIQSSLEVADVVIHARSDIDDDGKIAGWFLTDEQGGDEIPDPLSSGTERY